MRIDHLSLRGFRNYTELEADFVPGVNLILGDNAQGKTNLLEAISYLSTGHGFRTRKESELLQFGADFADLEAKIWSQQREQTVRAVLFAGKRPRQLYLGGVKQKSFSKFQGLLTTVLFCPEDLLVLKTGAAQRRRLLDNALCQLRPGYEKALTEYHKLLDHKSRILKDWREYPTLADTLPEFNLRMAQVGAILIGYRANYLDNWIAARPNTIWNFPGEKRPCGCSIKRFPPSTIPICPVWNWSRRFWSIRRPTCGPSWSPVSA